MPGPYFARECVRQELSFAKGNHEAAVPLIADWLLAIALISAGRTSPAPAETDILTFGDGREDDDAIGPFAIREGDWSAFLGLATTGGKTWGQGDRFFPSGQLAWMEWRLQKDWEEASALIAPQLASSRDAGSAYVPTLLDLYVIHVAGPKAFAALRARKEKGEDLSAVDLGDLLGASERKLLQDVHPWLFDAAGTGAVTVRAFVDSAWALLDAGLASALALFKTAMPEFVAPSGAAPWNDALAAEAETWAGKTENTWPSKVGEYFGEIGYDAPNLSPGYVTHWCGAFVGAMVSRAGASLPDGPAKADNWRRWGEVAFNMRDPAAVIPHGAVVVLNPDGSDASGTAGHVTFFAGFDTSRTPPTRFLGIGGNQGDTVRKSSYPIAGVMHVGALSNATSETDLLILARTLYGEVRGELARDPDEVQAVADVILNRVGSPRYPDTARGVCLQASQFSCWNGSDPNRAKIVGLRPDAGDALFDRLLAIARTTLGKGVPGASDPLVRGALHYYAARIAEPAWVLNSPDKVVTRSSGKHVFLSGIR